MRTAALVLFVFLCALLVVWFTAFAPPVQAWWARKLGLCWHLLCFRRVTRCQAGSEHNGPMCDRHCREAGYHAFFCGCNEPGGIPQRETLFKPLRVEIEVVGRRIDGGPRLRLPN